MKFAGNGVSLLRLLGTTVAFRVTAEGCSRGRCVKADRAGTAVLFEQIDPRSLTRTGSRIHWTEHGLPRSAALD